MLIGPTPILRGQRGMPVPRSSSNRRDRSGRNRLLLDPFCCYGRERVHDGVPAGSLELFEADQANALEKWAIAQANRLG
jgi:hypothetical protein